MGCNCGRRRGTPPVGLTTKRPDASTTSTSTTSGSTGSTNESSGTTQSFVLQTPSGTTTYGSRLERDAARARLTRGR